MAILKRMLLTTLALCSLCVTVSAATFDDIPATHWAHRYIQEMSYREVIQGYDDGTFRSDETISTAQYLVMLCRCIDLDIAGTQDDVWYQPYLTACLDAGILEEGECADPDAPITRKEAALFTYRAMGSQDVAGQEAFISLIGDFSTVADTVYAQPILSFYAFGIVQGGTDGAFYPDATITRGATAAILCRSFVEELRVMPLGTETYATNVPILMYHEIGDGDTYLYVSESDFANQLDYLLANGYTTVTMEQLSNHWLYDTPLPEKPVVLTFDDGCLSMYETVMPMLLERGQTATFFIIDEATHWDSRFVSYAQIKEMSDAGLEIGSHSWFHIRLADQTDEVVWDNLQNSKTNLEAAIGKPIYSLCYPFGSTDDEVIAIAKEVGYESALITLTGLANESQGMYQLKRMTIARGENLSVFAARLKGIG